MSIFYYLLAYSRNSYLERYPVKYELEEVFARMGGRAPPTPPPRKLVWYWTDSDSHSPSLFPFNIARVCTKWRDILAQFPEYWTRIVFDVAADPAPLLEAFSWSKNLEGIDVVVFTSEKPSRDIEEEIKARENHRVAAIAQAFQPHTYRCKSISFDVIYESSLPPPGIFFLREAPVLEELTLKCAVYDIDTTNSTSRPTMGGEKAPLVTSFGRLRKIFMTGFWIMDLLLSAGTPKWFQDLKLESRAKVSISHFRFHDEGQYTLANFLLRLSSSKVERSFHFRDLSLAYPVEDRPIRSDEFGSKKVFSAYKISFKSVSKEFLAHFYALVQVEPEDSLTFKDCEIPHIPQLQDGYQLTLENIIDDDNSQSLCNILGSWAGAELIVRSCPSFNDAILKWLGSEVLYIPLTPDSRHRPFSPSTSRLCVLHYHAHFGFGATGPFLMFPADQLRSLDISNCENVTPRRMRKLLIARHTVAMASPDYVPADLICEVSVKGRGSGLSQVDRDWFLGIADLTTVHWMMTNAEGVKEDHDSLMTD
ncbi:hypothetical protein GALMADRAFT_143355 [Galerina marginata CBS 339.88]|uniref:F-box domain-containing protein n=1 Tax=Galerina marginata (strain CBS 339.88) TaxID=685588 RepID=A0A067SM61_GALM3|nr:hypothetical protein GALMADRAFT_143355 [Galerina marginata CBS 339.88]